MSVMAHRATLNSICEFIIDCEHKTAPTQEEGYPSIRTPNIGRGRLILDGVNRVSEDTYIEWTQRAIPQSGDLILAREAPVGNVAIIPRNLKVCLGQRTVLIRPNKSTVNADYLVYLLLGNEVQGKIHSLTAGATVAHLNMGEIRKMELPPLPPLPTQHKIAAILSAYDDLIENNTRRIKILEEVAQAIYREWFVHFCFPGHEGVRMVESDLGLIPEGWDVARLGNICKLIMGQSPKSVFYNEIGEGLPFHQGVTNFGFRYPVDQIYCSITNRIAEQGDILFSVRAPVGRINLSNKKIVIGRGLSAIRHKKGYQLFFYYQLKEMFKDEDTIGGGTIFKAVTKDDMINIKCLSPPNSLLKLFNKNVEPISSQLDNLINRNVILRRTRDLLIPKLINGDIEMSEADIRIPETKFLNG